MTLGLVVVLLAACGSGDDGSDPTNAAPTASFRFASSVPVNSVVTLDGTGSGAAGGRTLTYSWTLTSKPSGSAATLSSLTAVSPTITPDLVGTYGYSLTVTDGIKSNTASGTMTATVAAPPTITSDIVEPLTGTIQLGLSADPGASTVTWTVDGNTIGTGLPLEWDTTTVADGNHLVSVRLLFASNYYYDVTRTFQVGQSPVNFSNAQVSAANGQVTALLGAFSANGIVSLSATLDGVSLGTLTAPNACQDTTGVACATTGLNGYSFVGSVVAGAHVVIVTATDGIGKSVSIQLRVTST